MKQLKLLLFIVTFSACGNEHKGQDADTDQNEMHKMYEMKVDSLSAIVTKQNALITEMRDSIAILKFPADQRMEQAKRLIAEEKYDQALKELNDLKRIFPNSSEAQACASLVESINKKKEEKIKEEERIRALGFKALQQRSTIEIDYNKISISSISVGNKFIFDSYDSRYFYRDAERGKKYVTMAMSVTSTSHNPRIPQLAFYTIQGDKMLLDDTFTTKFARWSDYVAYLGNYHDSRNDFAYVSTVNFKLGLQVSEENLRGPYAIVLKKENGLSLSSFDRFRNPPVYYSGSVPYPNTLSIDDFSNNYVLVKLFNLR